LTALIFIAHDLSLKSTADLATTGTILGFALMMFLDVAFGK
jgi:hypothetical protein